MTSRSQRSQSILTLSSTTVCTRRRRRSVVVVVFLFFSLGRPLIALRKLSSCLMAPPMGECSKVVEQVREGA